MKFLFQLISLALVHTASSFTATTSLSRPPLALRHASPLASVSKDFSENALTISEAAASLRGKTIVVKYGGNAMTSPELKAGFCQDVAALQNLDLSATAVVKTCNSDCTIDSTVGRELLYNLEHCIHHLALIKIGLKLVAPQIELPTHFGFARSTILHKEKNIQVKSN